MRLSLLLGSLSLSLAGVFALGFRLLFPVVFLCAGDCFVSISRRGGFLVIWLYVPCSPSRAAVLVPFSVGVLLSVLCGL